MHKVAASTIRGGLSWGARILLGLVAGLFGVLMLAMAPDATSPVGFAAFGLFCIAIALACMTSGRVRQFVGSVIASVIVGLSVCYLWSEFTGGVMVSGKRSEPSLLNAGLFLVFFGLPSIAYI